MANGKFNVLGKHQVGRNNTKKRIDIQFENRSLAGNGSAGVECIPRGRNRNGDTALLIGEGSPLRAGGSDERDTHLALRMLIPLCLVHEYSDPKWAAHFQVPSIRP